MKFLIFGEGKMGRSQEAAPKAHYAWDEIGAAARREHKLRPYRIEHVSEEGEGNICALIVGGKRMVTPIFYVTFNVYTFKAKVECNMQGNDGPIGKTYTGPDALALYRELFENKNKLALPKRPTDFR